jgi:type VI protein secretion system component Hcp
MPTKSKKRKMPLKAHDLKAKNDPKGGKGRKGRKGGKADFHDISFTHSIDKSSPVLLG